MIFGDGSIGRPANPLWFLLCYSDRAFLAQMTEPAGLMSDVRRTTRLSARYANRVG
jgi:hypothetical protein